MMGKSRLFFFRQDKQTKNSTLQVSCEDSGHRSPFLLILEIVRPAHAARDLVDLAIILAVQVK